LRKAWQQTQQLPLARKRVVVSFHTMFLKEQIAVVLRN